MELSERWSETERWSWVVGRGWVGALRGWLGVGEGDGGKGSFFFSHPAQSSTNVLRAAWFGGVLSRFIINIGNQNIVIVT